ALQRFSQEQGATLFMTLLAAFNILLARYSGQDDIVVGAGIANRNRHEIENLMGFFVNTLVIRTDLANNPPFQTYLSQVRQVALQGMHNQDVPFERVVQALQPERSVGYNPLFQVMFAVENYPMDKIELTGLSLTPLDIDLHTAKFDLNVSISERDRALHVVFEYNTNLFYRQTIQGMARHFQTLLA